VGNGCAWRRLGLEATIIVLFPRAKASSFQLELTLQSVGAVPVAPLRITRLATLDTRGVPPQVVPSSLRDLSVQATVRFPVRVS
jgi:hypothetical protein